MPHTHTKSIGKNIHKSGHKHCLYFYTLYLNGAPSAYQCKSHRDSSSIPGLGRFPEGGNGNPLQCSCLENPRDRGIWWATVHGVTKSQTRPSVHLCVLTSGNVTYPLLLYLLLYCFPNTFLTLLVYSLVSQVSTNF